MGLVGEDSIWNCGNRLFNGMDLKKINVSTIKDIIYIVTILLGVAFFFRDKAVNQAILNEQIRTMQSNQDEILKKLQDNDIRWYEQIEQNGKFSMYIILDSK